MVEVFGYLNKYIEVDLATKDIGVHNTEELPLQEYLGGRGLGSYLLWRRNKAGVDPLSPENHLIIMTGPYTGTSTPFSAYFSVVTKSPLTGTILSSHSGGSWGVFLKKSGFDGIVIRGIAEEPSVLVIDQGEVKLESHSDLWGKDVYETTSRLLKLYPAAKVLTIGPAGEHLVKFASIMNDRYRTAGRGGAGAVMGSKKLKAIVVRGKLRPKVKVPEEVKSWMRTASQIAKEKAARFRYYGTPAAMLATQALSALPSYNYSKTQFDGFEQIQPDVWRKNYVISNKACSSCPIACSHISVVKDNGRTIKTEGPEYETFYAFGPQVGVKEIPSIIKSNDLCNRFGLDTITTGNVIAFAMELSEKGLLNGTYKQELEDLQLHFGNSIAVIKLIERIAYRSTKLGSLLAEGTKTMSQRLGDLAKQYAIHVKGLELPAYDPRATIGMALAYATSPRGGCHLRATMYVPELFQQKIDRFAYDGEKLNVLIEMQNLFAVLDSMVICKFGARYVYNNDITAFANMINAITGWALSSDDLYQIGERIWTLERLFNLNEGFSKKDDQLPLRFFKEPGSNDVPPINEDMFVHALQKYYELRKWDANGMPTSGLIQQLGLNK